MTNFPPRTVTTLARGARTQLGLVVTNCVRLLYVWPGHKVSASAASQLTETADAHALTRGVRRLRPSMQGTDDRGRLPGVFRLHTRSGWNEMHQNRRR